MRSVFGSIKTPPHHKQIEYSAFYEVVFDDTSFRAEFLHGLGKRPFLFSEAAKWRQRKTESNT